LIVGNAHGFAGDLASYLRYDGAHVVSVADLAAAAEVARDPSSYPSVWVIVGDEESSPESLAVDEPADRVGIVVIEYGRSGRPRIVPPGTVVVNRNGLTRRRFITAVATAAGCVEEESLVWHDAVPDARIQGPSRIEALRKGRLILVAEDNETNQKVILRQFELLGFAADIVDTGVQALAKWRSGDYALVLTDLHMPEMDGYDLTRSIRAEEAGERHIPIVVLTANALHDEVPRCREAGADDFLTKPAQLASLKAVLERWVPTETARESTTSAPDAPVDVAVLAALVGGDPEIIREFMQDFRDSAAKVVVEFSLACTDGTPAEAAAAAHKLKSSARTVGAFALGELCDQIELGGHVGKHPSVDGLLLRFDAEYARVNGWLDTWLAAEHHASIEEA
jgi:CheY-like chemotaxis protein